MQIDWFPLWLSLRVAALSTGIALVVGLWIAYLLANRRFRGKEVLDLSAAECMTREPKTISADEFATAALNLMEQRRITSLVVAVELCSLTLCQEDLRRTNLVASVLFGDGAAAAMSLTGGNTTISFSPAIRWASRIPAAVTAMAIRVSPRFLFTTGACQTKSGLPTCGSRCWRQAACLAECEKASPVCSRWLDSCWRPSSTSRCKEAPRRPGR